MSPGNGRSLGRATAIGTSSIRRAICHPLVNSQKQIIPLYSYLIVLRKKNQTSFEPLGLHGMGPGQCRLPFQLTWWCIKRSKVVCFKKWLFQRIDQTMLHLHSWERPRAMLPAQPCPAPNCLNWRQQSWDKARGFAAESRFLPLFFFFRSF